MNFLKGLLLVCLIVLQACHYKNIKEDGGDQNTDLSAEQIDFAFVMKEVIGPRCLECHAPGGQASFMPFVTYTDVKDSGADIKLSVSDDSMPKNRSPLTTTQKQILISWIDAGMPETISANPVPTEPKPVPTVAPTVAPTVPPTPPPPVEPAKDWLSVKTLVLDPSCVRCHSAPANRAGINVETYQNVITNLSIIEKVIRDGSMPIRGSLTPEQKKLILDWIQVGAPEFATP